MEERELRTLIAEVKSGRLSRRGFVQVMVGLGLTALGEVEPGESDAGDDSPGDGFTPASSGCACVRVIVDVGFFSPKPLIVTSSQATSRLVARSK